MSRIHIHTPPKEGITLNKLLLFCFYLMITTLATVLLNGWLLFRGSWGQWKLETVSGAVVDIE